jgi:hypothetical protein
MVTVTPLPIKLAGGYPSQGSEEGEGEGGIHERKGETTEEQVMIVCLMHNILNRLNFSSLSLSLSQAEAP